ncbi:MAG TPA: reverse transcriptase domain-containing protein [Syntrophorhabdales bacterium]|nr:reverse transcriptase domain-containing protein [Syntrophorhabdales bacterium]
MRHHTDCQWVLLYVERWLKAPVAMPDGTLENREKGTSQGSVVSRLLANLFLHYVFDRWMRVHYPDVPFERYADDAICHCKSEKQARMLQADIATRLSACKLELRTRTRQRSCTAWTATGA